MDSRQNKSKGQKMKLIKYILPLILVSLLTSCEDASFFAKTQGSADTTGAPDGGGVAAAPPANPSDGPSDDNDDDDNSDDDDSNDNDDDDKDGGGGCNDPKEDPKEDPKADPKDDPKNCPNIVDDGSITGSKDEAAAYACDVRDEKDSKRWIVCHKPANKEKSKALLLPYASTVAHLHQSDRGHHEVDFVVECPKDFSKRPKREALDALCNCQ
jgi:hypothetical protein